MTLSLRNQRVRLFVAEEIGTNGFPRKRYRAIADAWARVEPPTGRDLERFEGTSHVINAVITLHKDAPVSEGGMIRVLPGDDGMQDYRIASILPRRMTYEQHVYASSMFQNEEPHEIDDADLVPVTRYSVTPIGPQHVMVGSDTQLVVVPEDTDGNPLVGRTLAYSSTTEHATVDENGLVHAVSAGFALINILCEASGTSIAFNVSAAVARIVVTPPTFSLAIGATQQLTVTLYDADDNVLTGRVVTIESADEEIATVDDDALVTGVAGGEVAIVVACEGVTTAVVATVVAEAAVALVIISPTDFSLNLGATQQLTIVTKDAQGNVLTGRAVTFQSTASSKVAVSSSGLVTASASNAGVAAIIATSEGVSSAIAVASVDPYAPYTAFDSVTRGNSTSSLGTATEKGGAWTVLLGVGGVSGGKLYAVTAPMRAKLGTMPGGNGTVQADCVTADWVNNNPALLFRMTDKDNNLVITFTSTTNGAIRYRIAGALTAFVTFNPALTNSVPATVKVIAAGATVIILVNGVLKLATTLTGSALTPSGTNAGFSIESTSPATTNIDNYQVTA